jgi:predicted nuclease of predicted toxin-antitoxin system
VTADLDYPRLLALTQAEGPGLILFRGGNYSEQETVERLMRALEMIPNEELPSSIVVIEKGRIRRRRLPIEVSS